MDSEFAKLRLKKEILDVIEKVGFQAPTSIQTRAIPHILQGSDVIATAATGSGKTLAYVLPMVQHIEVGKGAQGVVIVPTRELAKQVGEVFKTFSEDKGLNVLVSYGGSNIKAQKDKLQEFDIIVATAGRIIEFIKEDNLRFHNLKTLVLDEVDSMFQNQFMEELDYILHNMPRKKQVLMFSATIDTESFLKVKKWLKKPIRVSVEKYLDPKKLKQVYYVLEPDKKLSLLHYLLEQERAGLSMVFTNRHDTADFLVKNLKDTGLDIRAIHGEMAQGKRNKVLKDFSEEKFDVLICTDFAARGLDIDNVSHIYNYNIPKHHEKYIHRIGRTARMGKSGKVINLICKNDVESFLSIMKEHQIHLKDMELPAFPEIKVKKELVKKKYNAHIKQV